MMTEAEVSIRLATWLIVRGMVDGPVRVAIDGAQIKTGDRVHFALGDFMTGAAWVGDGDGSTWRCTYQRSDGDIPLEIHSRSGVGDVVAPLRTGEVFRAECKKGPLTPSASSREYPLLREALGQLLTVAEVGERDILAVAVPHSEKFVALASRWRQAPLVRRVGIRILTVGSDGEVNGFDGPA